MQVLGRGSWMFASGPSTARITSATVISRVRGRANTRPVAPPSPDQAGVLELEQDVLQELERDLLGLGELLTLDRLALPAAAASSSAARTA